MKISKTLKKQQPAGKATGNQKGVALVLVLTVMSLSTIMILSFFSLATSENQASATYSRGLQAQQVAEQAVNMVIAQIRKATSQDSIAWASQPGAIRTWDDSGRFKMGYKLYSDDVMQEPQENAMVNTDYDEAQNWTSLYDEFVDLNEPVIRGEKVYFPIVDPLARDLPEWPKEIGGETDTAGVEGFDFNFDNDHILDPGELDQVIKGINGVGHLAMPVRWVYQLADGTLGTLQNGQFKSLMGNITPDEDNQIVARFAFWADDETTKLNLNVHAGGLSWDTPRAGGDLDMDMGKYQPLQKEFQRYPGHPSTTHLVPALAPGVLDIVRNKNAMEMIFRTVPRIVGGGSESGTRKANPSDKKERNGLIPDNDPLLPSVDEYVMRPDREPTYFPQADGRPAPVDEMSEMMERVRFFVTATSRAPEETLFNTPRVACWPITPDEMTAFDELIAFCATLNDSEYFFKRKNADSSNADFYGAGMQRNKDVYNYLAKLMDSRIPGVGGRFSDKWGNKDRYQVLTQIFDYIRSTNLHDDSIFGERWEDAFKTTNSDDHRTYTNPRRGNPNNQIEGQSGIHKGHGQVTPIRITEGGVTTRGFGRFYTLKDIAVHAICVADGGDGGVQSNFAEALGGGGTGDVNPGFSVYGGGMQDVDEGISRSNFPPMPFNVSVNDPTSYPTWLRDWLNTYLNHEGEWRALPGGPPADLSLKGNWEQRYQWRLSPGRAGYWQEVVEIITPAFEASNWNWNLMYNRIRTANGSYIPVAVDEQGRGDSNDNTLYARDQIAPNDFMRLGPNEKMVQAALVFNLFCPSQGWVPINPDMSVRVELFDYGASDAQFKFVSLGAGGALKPRVEGTDGRRGKNKYYGSTDDSDQDNWVNFLVHYDLENELLDPIPTDREWWYTNDRQSAWHHRHSGGTLPFTYVMGEDRRNTRTDIGPLLNPDGTNVGNKQNGWSTGRFTPLSAEYYKAHDCNRYAFITRPFRIGPSDVVNTEPYDGIIDTYPFAMTGGNIKVHIYSHSGKDPFTNTLKNNGTYNTGQLSAPEAATELVQTIDLDFPSIASAPPFLASGRPGYINEFGAEERQPVTPMEMWSLGIRGNRPGTTGRLYRISSGNGQLFHRNDVVQSVGVLHGDVRLAAVNETINPSDDIYGPHFRYADGTNHELAPYYDNPHLAFARMAHDMAMSTGHRFEGGDGRLDSVGRLRRQEYTVDDIDFETERSMQILPGLAFRGKLPPNAIGDRSKYIGKKVNLYGDFDNGMGLLVDGPYINKADEGNSHSLFKRTDNSNPNAWELRRDYGDFPYFVRDWLHEAGGPSYFSPNRIMSGPGMFGSLPTGVWSKKPWQTLLFRPAAGSDHPGAAAKFGGEDPADHYLLDFFWMPVVEPYAISEPLSTAGKVNLNYQILPFRNVKRNTAMRGIFRSELMVLIPTVGYDPDDNTQADAPSLYTKNYKHNSGRGSGWHWRDKPNGGFLQGKRLRANIHEGKTLEQFQDKFDDGEIFKSASEICEMHLIPQQVAERLGLGSSRNKLETYTPDVSQMEDGSFWQDHAAIGDNSRERPYTNIYNRITTKSNTFKVHYRGQVLKQGRRPSGESWDWNPEMDTVVGQYRGSSIVERYIDPNSNLIPDYASIVGNGSNSVSAALSSTTSLGELYRFRVVNQTRFAP